MDPRAGVWREGVAVVELGEKPVKGVVAGGDVSEGCFVEGAEGCEEGVVGEWGGGLVILGWWC